MQRASKLRRTVSTLGGASATSPTPDCNDAAAAAAPSPTPSCDDAAAAAAADGQATKSPSPSLDAAAASTGAPAYLLKPIGSICPRKLHKLLRIHSVAIMPGTLGNAQQQFEVWTAHGVKTEAKDKVILRHQKHDDVPLLWLQEIGAGSAPFVLVSIINESKAKGDEIASTFLSTVRGCNALTNAGFFYVSDKYLEHLG